MDLDLRYISKVEAAGWGVLSASSGGGEGGYLRSGRRVQAMALLCLAFLAKSIG